MRREPDQHCSNSDTLNSLLANLTKRYEGDNFSRGPLGTVSKLAADVHPYREHKDKGYRFEPSTSYRDEGWAFPSLRLGLRGFGRATRMFVIPQNFINDLPYDPDWEEEALEERVPEWLEAKGLLVAANRAIADIKFDKKLGYGWRPFRYELLQSIWAAIRPKFDGSPGIWITANFHDSGQYYPRLPQFDALLIEAVSRPDWFAFHGFDCHGDLEYGHRYLMWPTYDHRFMSDGMMPEGAASGVIQADYEGHDQIEGWIDDLDNAEVQNLMFSSLDDIRFCPSVAVNEDVPPPCQHGTIAAAIFANAGCDGEDRVARRLLRQAQALSTAGLTFHDALLGHNRELIERMFSD